jgi:nucleotide-binding universal stress UspA family protein
VVVVGTDGSAPSLEAVRQAALAAQWRDSPLRIVHAFSWPAMPAGIGPWPDGGTGAGLLHDAENMLDIAAKAARDVSPGLELSTHLVPGWPVPVLLAAAREAGLLVLGGRGLSEFSGIVIGSVTAQVAAHSPVPVLVCKGFETSDGPVVAGADGSGWATTVLEAAHAEARWRKTALLSVTCVPRVEAAPYDMPAPSPWADTAPERLSPQELSALSERYPEIEVRAEVIRGEPAEELAELSRDAQLMVVGSRGLGALSGLLLGSVSQHVLYHARCPVLIVRHRA